MFVNKKIEIQEIFIKSVVMLLILLFFVFSTTTVIATTTTQTDSSVLSPVSTSDTNFAPVDTPEEESSTEETSTSEDLPELPQVTSSTFTDQEIWYKSTEGHFKWILPSDISEVAVEISTSSENKPENNSDAILEQPIDEFTISKDLLQDGVQFLSISFKNEAGWGPALNYKIQIDNTSPEHFDIFVKNDTVSSSFPVINFEAEDKTSGIDYYEIFIASNEPIKVTPNEARLGYQLRNLENGTYSVRVVAHDKAGNIRENSQSISIMAGWVKPVNEKSFWSLITSTNIIVLLLISIVLFQLVYILHKQKQIKLKEEKLRRENLEVQSQMEKIFSALRDEIYDQIGMINKRKRLSKNEKEAVKGLNQALEISETLIEREINDVNAILK